MQIIIIMTSILTPNSPPQLIPDDSKQTNKNIVEGVKLLCRQFLHNKRRLRRRAIALSRQLGKQRDVTPSHHCHTSRGGSRRGKKTRPRERRTVNQIYKALGPIYFKRAYRMSYASFWKLHDSLLPYLVKATGYKDCSKSFYLHNGPILHSTRLACAIRYFAGGSPYDIVAKYGIGHTDVFNSVWYVVDAINMHPDMSFSYPESHEEQRKIADGFRAVSAAGFDCCAGAVDGILIWTHRPTKDDCRFVKCDAMKFMCGRKNKYGLNCQAVSDARGKFLDMSIIFPGSTSDCLAFEGSRLFQKLENGLLDRGLCLFGDNAYINALLLAIPYTGSTSKYHDSYNFHHSQLRIRVECAFGMFTQRWGILRSAIPKGISIQRTIALVFALAKLHNFCIDEAGSNVPTMLASDENNIANSADGIGSVNFVQREQSGNQPVPADLLDGGHHFDDVDSNRRQRQQARCNSVLPREQMRLHLEVSGLLRPTPYSQRMSMRNDSTA